jgi:hypothetical protein
VEKKVYTCTCSYTWIAYGHLVILVSWYSMSWVVLFTAVVVSSQFNPNSLSLSLSLSLLGRAEHFSRLAQKNRPSREQYPTGCIAGFHVPTGKVDGTDDGGGRAIRLPQVSSSQGKTFIYLQSGKPPTFYPCLFVFLQLVRQRFLSSNFSEVTWSRCITTLNYYYQVYLR